MHYDGVLSAIEGFSSASLMVRIFPPHCFIRNWICRSGLGTINDMRHRRISHLRLLFCLEQDRTGAMTAPRSVYTRFYIASKKYILYPVSRFQISRRQIYA